MNVGELINWLEHWNPDSTVEEIIGFLGTEPLDSEVSV